MTDMNQDQKKAYSFALEAKGDREMEQTYAILPVREFDRCRQTNWRACFIRTWSQPSCGWPTDTCRCPCFDLPSTTTIAVGI